LFIFITQVQIAISQVFKRTGSVAYITITKEDNSCNFWWTTYTHPDHHVARSLVFCVLYSCGHLIVFLLWFTVSDYPWVSSNISSVAYITITKEDNSCNFWSIQEQWLRNVWRYSRIIRNRKSKKKNNKMPTIIQYTEN
jgi:hypothetical protein